MASMKVNLHTHTVRCRHASGSEREYIESAINGGLTRLGFSDHAPYPFPGDYKSGFRMDIEQQGDYVDTLLSLKEEYRDIIDIRIGYEVEYYEPYFKECINMLASMPVDYLILGQHFIFDEREGRYSGSNYPDPKNLTDYVYCICKGIESGVYTYIAHPDLCGYAGDTVVSDELYGKMIECAKEHGVPLEINMLGLREHRIYPREHFFELCGQIGAGVCIGSDAHSPNVVIDENTFDAAMAIVDKYKLNYVESPILRPVHTL